MKKIFKVTVLHTHRDYFDYYAETELPCVGARVWVPFRQQTRMGVVIGEYQPEQPHANMKSIIAVIDKTPLLSSEVLALCQWVGRYYQSPLSEVIPLALPKKYREKDRPETLKCHYYLAMTPNDAYQQLSKRAPRQQALIDFFADKNAPLSKPQILAAGFSTAQLKALVQLNIVTLVHEKEKPEGGPLNVEAPLSLNPEQAIAVHQISAHLSAYRCFLLKGVTGSGKTEVYLQVIARVLAAGRQVLILVPEIGLTPQLLARFRARFKEPMVVIHSGLNDTERQKAWAFAKEEAVKLVIGTRAAVFTPMPALGLIVVDEEHDMSLKQMDGVRYSARDTALMRAHLRHIPIILGSATPSLESLHNCALNKYALLQLNQKALSNKALRYQILDIRQRTLQHGIAEATLERIKVHLNQQNQVLVFINRRGFAPVLFCHQCGWMADCRACDAHLTLHRQQARLICHHCGLMQAVPSMCQQCKTSDLLPVGAGTQRVYEYLSTACPDVNILRIDRDEVRKKDALDHCLNLIHTGEAQLLVGTQMLAKGHHFPRLTLVVVLDADNGFYNQDFRALEHLGQLLTQVAGRAGRAEFPGEVLIQTHVPQHPLLNLLIQQGYSAFAESLLTLRQQADMPPYHFLTLFRAEGKNMPTLLDGLHKIKNYLQALDVITWGPAPAPLARKAHYHRMQLLIKSPSRPKLMAALTTLRESLATNKWMNGIRWHMDVDPMDLS